MNALAIMKLISQIPQIVKLAERIDAALPALKADFEKLSADGKQAVKDIEAAVLAIKG